MKRKAFFYGLAAVALLMCAVPGINGAPLDGEIALERLAIWMDNHPVMGKLSGDNASITSTFPESGDGYAVYSDTNGDVQGSHAVTFTKPFNWSAM